ncbi:N-acetylglucosamine-6-phosphate deacetylase [Flaviaesturariibacter terrae]
MFYRAERIFDGTSWRSGGIETEAGRVAGFYKHDPGAAREGETFFEGCVLLPAFVDAQVYGAAGRLFSAYPEPRSLQLLANEAWAGGAALCQPTVATNSPEIMRACIDAVRGYWKAGGEGIGGLHLEGPWISPERLGAHLREYVHQPSVGEVRALLDYGRGVIRTITLAPEQCAPAVLDELLAAGIVLSAGHSNATYNESMEAFGRGIRAVTHLYNAMSPLQHRAPGLVGASFEHGSVCASIIPDGIHVDWPAIRIAATLMDGRLFAITDAVTQTDCGPYRHQRTPEGYYTSGGTLSGSALSMEGAFRNLRSYAGLSPERALQMCSTLPAALFGWDAFGKIRPGSAACFLVYDRDWNLVTRISEQGSRTPALCGAGHTGETS